MKYYIEELCIKTDGTDDNGVYIRDTEKSAMKLFYQKCGTHEDSELWLNAIVEMKDQTGRQYAQRIFTYEPVVEAETVETEE